MQVLSDSIDKGHQLVAGSRATERTVCTLFGDGELRNSGAETHS